MALEKSSVRFYFTIRTDSNESSGLSAIGISPAAKKATPVEAGAKLWQAEVKNATTASLITDALVQVLTGVSGSNPTVAVYIPAGKAKEILNTQVEVKVYNGSNFSSVTVKIDNANKIKSADASSGSVQPGPEEVTATRSETRAERKEKGSGASTPSTSGDAGAPSAAGRTAPPEVAQTAAPDTPVSKDKLNLQADALQKVYDAAKSIEAPAGAGEDLQLSIQTMISVRNNEFQDSLGSGATWTPAHSRILRLAAKKLLEDVSNPELQQFVQSYDAAMSGGDVLEETNSLGITIRGIAALSSFVSANMDTQPQKGLGQLILKKADAAYVLSPRGPTLLASAWALIFSLHSEFVRIKTLNAIGSSPVMRYPVPSREDSDRNDEPSALANVKANLTLKVWSQADRDGFFDVGPDSIVVIFKPAAESFAKTVAQLPVGTGFASLLKTARGTREELINADRGNRGGKK